MNRRLLLIACLVSAITSLSPGQITPPRVGVLRYASGSVYPVFGVPGNYVVGKRLLDAVDAISSSDAGVLLVRKGILQLLDTNLSTIGSFDAGAGKAVVGMDTNLDSAIAFIPARHCLVHWSGSEFVSVVVAVGVAGSDVFSTTRTGPDTASLLSTTGAGPVEEDVISLRSGTLISRTLLPGATATVYRQGGSLISVQGGQLVSTATATGTRKSIPLRGNDVSFEKVSGSCLHVHVASSGRDWLVHFSGDMPSLFELGFELPVAGSGMAQ